MIPIHPTPGPDPRTVRWNLPTGTLPDAGALVSVPRPFVEMYADGTVTGAVVGQDHLDVTLAEGRSWQVEGAKVRSALLAALEHPELWEVATPAAPPGPSPAASDDAVVDARLREAATAVLVGEVGELARSHGGAIELVSVRDRVVTVRMEGACHGCPAAEVTLHARLERRLRQVCPELREVRTAGPQPSRGAVLGRPL